MDGGKQMYDNDYIVLIDENGQPYIAHGWSDRIRSAPAAARNAARTAGRKATKYIEKIVDKGKARYFYTQDELKAFYNNTRGRASNAVNQAKNAARRAASTAKEKAKDILGYDERERMKDAERRFNNAADNRERTTTYRLNKAEAAHTKEVDETYEALKKTRAEYRNTPLAFIEGLSEMAKDASDTIGSAAATIASNAKTKVEDLKDFAETVPGRAKEVASNVRTAASNAREAASNAIDKASDFYYDARATAKDAGGRVKEAASDAVDWARNVPTNVSNTVANNRALAEYKKLDKMNPDDMTEEEYNRWIGYQFRFGSIK